MLFDKTEEEQNGTIPQYSRGCYVAADARGWRTEIPQGLVADFVYCSSMHPSRATSAGDRFLVARYACCSGMRPK